MNTADAVERRILIPFHRDEATDPYRAARHTGTTPETIRRWAQRFGLGRRVAGRWYVSRPALAMFVGGDLDTLARYHAGDRSSPAVRLYFEAMGCEACLAELRQE